MVNTEPTLDPHEEPVFESGKRAAAAPTLAAQKLPARFRRAAVRGTLKWDLPRSFSGFHAADPSLSVRGAAPKCIIVNDSNPHDWYMAKAPENWGVQETFTELFISCLGARLGLPMAHHGVALVDDGLRFISRSFLAAGEQLVHGSILLESFFDFDLNKIGKNPWDEQRTYDIDMLDELISEVCGNDAQAVLQGLIRMLMFDALIGSNDRHMQNWGVITTATEPQAYRFAPIFDSARALLWDYDEERLRKLSSNSHAMEGYANRARPKIGCAKFGKAVNHFELAGYLMQRYSAFFADGAFGLPHEKIAVVDEIMREYPFRSLFSPLRKATVANILRIRAERLFRIARQKGEAHV
jgi:hypothetical protein